MPPHFARILFPCACLVCLRPLAGGSLCIGCTPRPAQGCHRCACCYSPLASLRDSLCTICAVQPALLSSVRYLWLYSGNARVVLQTIKYAPSRTLCRWAGKRLAEALPTFYASRDWDLIVPIPTTPMRRFRRGFNPAEELAFIVTRFSRRPVCIPHLLTVTRKRTPQAGLTVARRLQNARGSFRIEGTVPAGARILVVDDVLTTGATLREAATVLLSAGAAEVHALTLAATRLRLSPLLPTLCTGAG